MHPELSWAEKGLAAFKVPAHVEFRSELRHNTAGKVIKQGLVGSAPRAGEQRC